MKDKISIVVPIYNTAEYLPRCIESLLKQTYKSLEIILVDDGSNDKSCEIINEYSYKDSRIINIHNENRRGVSEARNTGIKIAKGKYISFVDSDDFIERDMYEVLIKNIQDYDADISICSYFVVQDNETIKTKNYYGIVEQFSTVSALRELIKREKYIDSVWGKLYRKDLIQGVSFELNKLGEDVIFNYQIFPRSKKVVFVDTPKYYYLKRPKSITGSLYHLKNFNFFYDNLERLDFIAKEFPSLFTLAQEKFLLYLLRAYKIFRRNPVIDSDKKKRRLIKNYLKENYKSLILNPLIDKKLRLFLRISRINFEIAYFLLYFYIKLRKSGRRNIYFFGKHREQ